MIGYVDEPLANSIINSDPIICRGWAYAECGITSIKISIDNREVGTATYGLLRNYLKTAHPQYSGIEKRGFFFFKKNSPCERLTYTESYSF